jgi:hypothetical protein
MGSVGWGGEADLACHIGAEEQVGEGRDALQLDDFVLAGGLAGQVLDGAGRAATDGGLRRAEHLDKGLDSLADPEDGDRGDIGAHVVDHTHTSSANLDTRVAEERDDEWENANFPQVNTSLLLIRKALKGSCGIALHIFIVVFQEFSQRRDSVRLNEHFYILFFITNIEYNV